FQIDTRFVASLYPQSRLPSALNLISIGISCSSQSWRPLAASHSLMPVALGAVGALAESSARLFPGEGEVGAAGALWLSSRPPSGLNRSPIPIPATGSPVSSRRPLSTSHTWIVQRPPAPSIGVVTAMRLLSGLKAKSGAAR